MHKFSKGTMPLTNLFKNCGYYGGAAALVGWDVSRRGPYSAQLAKLFAQLSTKTKVFVGGVGPLRGAEPAHAPPPGVSLEDGYQEKPRFLPRGPSESVCSPNRPFEIGSWICYSLATQSPASWAFTPRRVADGHVVKTKTSELAQAQVQGRGGVHGDAPPLLPGVF